MTRRYSPPPSPLAMLTLPARGALVLTALALVGGASSLVPVQGEILALMAGLMGVLALPLILPQPERHAVLALGWIALALALPITLALAALQPPWGLVVTLGASALWWAAMALLHRPLR
ncbi:hypothetical protein LCM17_04075 [Cereibacter sphaeroides]|nr:hypothetical protein [Cereibacter sphaeroides]